MKIQSFNDLRNYLHRGGSFWYLWTLPSKQSVWAEVGIELPIPNSHSDVFFSVNPSKYFKSPNERTKTGDIAAVNAVYAEFDGKDFGTMDRAANHIRSLTVKPTVVANSGGGWHTYFLLKDTFAIKTNEDLCRAKNLQSAWVEYTQSDNGSKDLTRILRVPGTRNWKEKYAPVFPEVKIVFSDLSRIYTFDQLEELIPPPPPPREIPQVTRFGKGYVERAIENETHRVLSALDGNRNNTLNIAAFSLGKLVNRGGVSRSRVEGTLLCAALAVGLPTRESERTIKSGLDGKKDA